ncbi:MAG: hypothetical protein IPJ89_00785 [Candidatus Iainarchaeum archaeon]|uniref:Uncharacterized protein n=1 Tax=Candidatus Iainarchaeum sp. TaxID=3101447 RepID=A0A7T9I1T9_9ARCH|nr:MAG: hypothetical protein IPJ89_00785 [Candidatus Diapherotrites archaeon]
MHPLPSTLLIALALILSMNAVSAATLEGEIYDGLTLQTINRVHITFGTDPPRLITTQEGRYHVELAPGTYTIYAEQREQGIAAKVARDRITIPADQDYVHDLFLFPPLQMTINQPLPAESEIAPDIFSNLQQPFTLLLLLGILLLGIEAAIIITRRNKAPVSEPPYQIMEINNMLPPLAKEEKKKKAPKKTRQAKLTS